MRAPDDVLVVGAGAVGAAVAFECAERGLRVRVIDSAGAVAAGCSRANAGLIAPSHAEPLTGAANIRTGLLSLLRADSTFHIRPSPTLLPWLLRFAAASGQQQLATATRVLRDLGAASLRRHREYAGLGVDTSLEQRGLVDVFASATALDKAVRSLEATPLRLDYEVWDAGRLAEQVPGLGPAAGGVHFAEEAHIDSRRLTEALLGGAVDRGARLDLDLHVSALLRERDRVTGVQTDTGPLLADRVVLATGDGTPQLLSGVGLRLPLAPAKGYVIDLEAGAGDPPLPVGVKESMIVVTPYRDRVRLAGTLELVGRRDGIAHRRTDAIRAAADRAFPSLRGRRVLQQWAGFRPCSADGLPVIGGVDGVDGLVLATGHGQQGVLLAPATGLLIADELTGRGDTPAHFSATRFAGPGTAARRLVHRAARQRG